MPETSRYPTFIRPALLPGLLGAVALLVSIAVVGTDWFLLFRFIVAILAVIVGVFAVQGRAWWWLIGLVPTAVLWNPILPVELDPAIWPIAHLIAAAVLVGAALSVKVPVKDDSRPGGARR